MRLGNGVILLYKLRSEDQHRSIDKGEIQQDDAGGVTVRRPDGSLETLTLDLLSDWEVTYIPSPPHD